jgi:hypothetical protein
VSDKSDWIHITIPRPDPAKTVMHINGVEVGEYVRRRELPRRPLAREDCPGEDISDRLLSGLTVNTEGYVFSDDMEVGRINTEGGISRVHWYKG